MRTTAAIAGIAAIVAVTFVASPRAEAAVDVSFGFFYSNLSPHGKWMVSAEYGDVWQPALYEPGWNPYYDGHWVWTDVGWTWVSDYAWGGIPYHYGTWILDPNWGWVWIPGYTWAPSWVVFRTGPDYVGWAPVPPQFTVGVTVTLRHSPDLFVFVGAGDFLAPRIRKHAVPRSVARRGFGQTRIINSFSVENNIVVNRGPDVKFIERATRTTIRELPIERVRGAGPGGHVSKAALRGAQDPVRREIRAAEPVPRDARTPRVDGAGGGPGNGKAKTPAGKGKSEGKGKGKHDERGR